MKDCAVCGLELEESNFIIAPCGDTYCGGCVNELFDRAAKHEFNFPPRCCGQIIPLESTEWLLSRDIYYKFLEKSEEVSTTNRTYCSDPECATFILTKAIDGREAKCPACQKLTCTVCKAEVHKGDCLEDPAIQPILTAATMAGFQQCLQCKRMIELSDGCYHITCICGAEFCYICGVKWKTCNCGEIGEQPQMAQDEELRDREADHWMNYALANVQDMHEDGRIEWREVLAAAAALE
ncbi:MAG: hypothetical protein ASARMPREDX12_003992 [Alectoria sarmentosa]|nr:MAG: hypothetical protein ASARMPREDX12_003992 [Alectoria sarmentosa]CAD6579315.1 MAG: hypothetical protein ASARMPRED_009036 [Alectoria sarmentosa]